MEREDFTRLISMDRDRKNLLGSIGRAERLKCTLIDWSVCVPGK